MPFNKNLHIPACGDFCFEKKLLPYTVKLLTASSPGSNLLYFLSFKLTDHD